MVQTRLHTAGLARARHAGRVQGPRRLTAPRGGSMAGVNGRHSILAIGEDIVHPRQEQLIMLLDFGASL
jgi:hypothetical protein